MNHNLRRLRTLSVAFLGLIALSSAHSNGEAESYEEFLSDMYRETVPLVTPRELAHQQSASHSPPLVFDTRTIQERAVSHIAGSQFIRYQTFDISEFDHLPLDQPIVLYCAVGYRSERVGEMLLAAGFTNVGNLYGGIIEWHNLGLPLVSERGGVVQEVSLVHGYRPRWGRWVTSDTVTYDPEPEE